MPRIVLARLSPARAAKPMTERAMPSWAAMTMSRALSDECDVRDGPSSASASRNSLALASVKTAP